MRERIRKV